MDTMAVVVTCVNVNDHTDVDPFIQATSNSFKDAMNIVKNLKKHDCKNTLLYELSIENIQHEYNFDYDTAVNFFDKNYVMTPLIVGLPKSNTLH